MSIGAKDELEMERCDQGVNFCERNVQPHGRV
jgi:hypothetical protein